ncbi:MAG: aminotransferase class IV [Desulfuromonadales bacterium]|nr:aminotransferase class IV [Desulfuromonadales bacterium]
MIINLNGQFVEPAEATWPLEDGARLYGDTLFETMLARGERIVALDAHLDRLQLSAHLLGFPCDRGRLEAACRETAARLRTPTSRLRLTLSRGPFSGLAFPPADAGHFALSARPYEEPTEVERAAGVVCLLAPNRRVNPLSHLPQMKRGNYADCLYAANAVRARGAREALFCEPDGRLLEGATSNLFVLLDGRLLTPPAGDLVLAGTMRRRVLQAAAAAGIPTEDSDLPLEQLWRAQEAFLTNALLGLLPIASLEGRPIGRGDRWRQLQAVVSQD